MKKKRTKIYQITKIKNGLSQTIEDEVVEESPLSIFLNEKRIVTLMCTPQDQKYLSLGFLFSEGLIKQKGQIKKVLFSAKKNEVKIFTKTVHKIPKITSEMSISTSGCGKGKSLQKIEDLDPLKDVLFNLDFTLSIDKIAELMTGLERKSSIFRLTGGTHSAGLADKNRILFFNEDIGRHNAVDKVLGEGFSRKIALKDKLLISSGRVSSDILLKTGKVGISIVISRSAPTSLAIQIAQRLGITIVGFARGKRMNVYTYPFRIKTN